MRPFSWVPRIDKSRKVTCLESLKGLPLSSPIAVTDPVSEGASSQRPYLGHCGQFHSSEEPSFT